MMECRHLPSLTSQDDCQKPQQGTRTGFIGHRSGQVDHANSSENIYFLSHIGIIEHSHFRSGSSNLAFHASARASSSFVLRIPVPSLPTLSSSSLRNRTSYVSNATVDDFQSGKPAVRALWIM